MLLLRTLLATRETTTTRATVATTTVVATTTDHQQVSALAINEERLPLLPGDYPILEQRKFLSIPVRKGMPF